MRPLAGVVAIFALGAVTACSIPAVTYKPSEDCTALGDEDGNGVADCDDPACSGGLRCLPPCGNASSDPGEECDDGNTVDGDGCDSNCTVTACGNDISTFGEECDDGDREDGDGCDSNCTVTACGNNAQTIDELCDDGNLIDGDDCDRNCTPTGCGNGVATAGEACDDGDLIDGNGCDSNCKPTGCGNGIASFGETCDDGNLVDGDDCDSNCTPTGCGNGVSTAGEACDDGDLVDGDGCDSNCTATACGNRIRTEPEECDDGNTGDFDLCTRSCQLTRITYFKASNTESEDVFGGSVALSADGTILAVGARLEDSAATGIGGDQASNTAEDAGAVYVLTRDGATWRQQAYVKASNAGAGDQFGHSIVLSADGTTMAVSSPGERSTATDIDGDQLDDGAPAAGAVYVFTRNGSTWTQQAYVKASNTGPNDSFGTSIALSADGSTLVVGAAGEASAATGVGGDQAGNSAGSSGAVYVFTREGTAWSQQAYVKASNTAAGDQFGFRVALSGDGSTLAVGALGEDSAATGIDGDQLDNAAGNSGAVYVFTRDGVTWTQQAYVKASNTGTLDFFGSSLALSADGATLAVGATNEASAATGIDGDQSSNAGVSSGAVYVLARSGTTWSQQAYVKASNTGIGDRFGHAVALAAEGSILAVSALGERSAATGIGGDEADNSAVGAGAIYLLARSGATWSQQSYIKASNTGGQDHLGDSVALSLDGSTVAAGAVFEDSAATGVGGDQTSNASIDSGAVYVLP